MLDITSKIAIQNQFQYNKNNMKLKYFVQTGLMVVSVILSTVSCTDTWDDHYDVSGTVAGSTIWANMQSEGDISPFVRVLQECGYADMLNGSQVFTVWAPLISDEVADNWIATYKEEEANNVDDDDNTTVHQFIENHIALFNHQISSKTDGDSVKMMNGKWLTMSNTMLNDEVNLVYESGELYSVPSSNGVLYKVDDAVDFFPNVWELIKLTTGGDDGLDSLAAFFLQYESVDLDEESSVEGGIVDGETVYLDSVMVTSNEMFQRINADLDCEDSLYWFLAPTNKAWVDNLDTYLGYFNYHSELGSDGDSLKQRYAKEMFVYASCFSERGQYVYNGNFNVDNPDSLCATTYRKSNYEYNKFLNPMGENGILYGLDPQECSNGRLYMTSDWRIKPTDLPYMSTIKVEAENSNVYDTYTLSGDSTSILVSVVTATNDAFDVSSNRYLVVRDSRTGRTNYPECSFQIPNTLSNCPYDIKVVFATPLAGDSLSTEDAQLKRRISASIRYYGSATGSMISRSNAVSLCSNVDVDATRMDTITVATGRTFPVCNYGEEDSRVVLTIQSIRGNSIPTGYTKNLLIDCIIFEPKLEDESE